MVKTQYVYGIKVTGEQLSYGKLYSKGFLEHVDYMRDIVEAYYNTEEEMIDSLWADYLEDELCSELFQLEESDDFSNNVYIIGRPYRFSSIGIEDILLIHRLAASSIDRTYFDLIGKQPSETMFKLYPCDYCQHEDTLKRTRERVQL